jgi:hypothetical protein
MQGTNGVVLVRNGSAKQSHNAVPCELVDCAFDPVHLGQHQLEEPVQHVVQHLRVNRLGQHC